MKDFIEVLVGLLLAFLFYTVFKRISVSLIQLFNIFSLIVLYFSLEKGETFGACLGTVCGLIQDAFSLGVFGVAGLSKTIMGFLAGYISRKLDVSPFFRKFILIFVLLCFEFVLWTFLSFFLYSERLLIGRTLQSFQPLATAVLGSIVFLLLGQIKKYSSLHST